MKQKGEIALLSSQCKEMSEEMSKMRIDLEGVAKELNEEKEQMPSKIQSALQPLKDDLALQLKYYARLNEALSQKVSVETHLLKDNDEFRKELKATKEEYDKKIETLSENIKNKESELSCEITRLSKENEELQSELKATKENFERLSENIEKIRQPSLAGDIARATASTPIMALLSTLDQLAAQMVSKETTNKRHSIMESHDSEVLTAHGLLSKDSFDNVITDMLILPHTYSGSSSGRGTLSRDDSNKLLSIDEGETSQSEDQVSSQAMELSASKVPLRPKKTTSMSTPAVTRTQSISEKEHNYLGVVWAMSDLTVAIKKLLETDSNN